MNLTPNRSVEITFDHSETVQVEPFFARNRERNGLRPTTLSDVEQLASGIWQLKPVQTNLFTLHETTTGQASIVRQADCETIPLITEIPFQRQYGELTGLTPAAGVSSSGDHFMLKRVPAGTSWSSVLSSPQVSPTLSPSPNYPMQRVVEHKSGASGGIDPAHQGYLVRWQHPGNPQSYVDYIFTFMFGGPVSSGGYGQFALTIGGAGRAKLHEWISGAWALVDEWIYAAPELITRQVHAMRIIPHACRFIEFRCSITEAPAPVGALTQLRPPGIHDREWRPQAHVYEATNRGSLEGSFGGYARPMTGPGRFRLDIRQDLRFPFNVTRLSYPSTGYLIDGAFRIPNTPTTTHALEVVALGMVSYNTSTGAALGTLTPQPINATSGANLSTQTETYTELGTTRTINGWQVPTAPHAVKVQMNLGTSASHVSPWLYGYEARRRGEFATVTPTAYTINASHFRTSPAEHLDMDQGDEDPSHARASIEVRDLVNRIPILQNRGDIPVRITSTWDPADQTKKTVLFEGYVTKSSAELLGKQGAVYPSPDWHDSRVECLGKWKRLAERDYPKQFLSFVEDTRTEAPLDPKTGRRAAWKVTDAIRHLLQVAGFPESQTDIPDLPLRFWTSNTLPRQDHLQIQMGESIGDWIQVAAHTYLNYFLVWDANAGSAGKWRLRPVPKYGDTSLWTYQLGGPLAGRLAHAAGAYGTNTTFVSSYERWVVAPEFNWLQMTGFGEGGTYTVQVRNPKSYNRPGESTADPTDPDYLGRLRPVYGRPDPRLCTPAAVKFAARTIFERAGRAAIHCRFTSPAVFVAPADSVYTTYTRRPHLFGDVITLNGDPYFVRSCRITMDKQHHMVQHVEAQMLRAPMSYS